MRNKALIFDLETTTVTTNKRKANPFNPANDVVARGWKKVGDAQCSWEYYPVPDRTTYLKIDDDVKYLVGHNIKFDLLYELCQGNPMLAGFFKDGGMIWDTQYAEYLLQGQRKEYHMNSLDDIIESYGGRKKIDVVKQMWDQGIDTRDIPKDILIDYLVGTEEEKRNSGDIGNTELIFRGQLAKAVKQKQVRMIQDRMDGLLGTIYMEFFGVKIDLKEAAKQLGEMRERVAKLDAELNTHVSHLPFEFNWGSTRQVSCLLFGGTVKYKQKSTYIDPNTGELARYKKTEPWPLCNGEPRDPAEVTHTELRHGVEVPIFCDGDFADTYLSGKKKGEVKYKQVAVVGELKEKICDFYHYFDKITDPEPEWKSSVLTCAGEPTYSTGGDVIDELAVRDVPFLKLYTEYKACTKELGTYLLQIDPKTGEKSGMFTCITPDGFIHHKLNHTSTVTSRLSSSDPNLQNLSRGDKSVIKRMFVSRFGAQGIMLESDYSQLEVVVQGVLSKCKALCDDLRARVDFHCKRVSAKNHITYEEAVAWCKDEKHPDYKAGKKERTKCKNFSFQRAYGAGAAAIAYQTGMDIEEVKQLMVQEDLMYPGVVAFNNNLAKMVEANAVPVRLPDEKTGEFKLYRRSTWQAPTGTIYTWRSYDAPAFMQRQGVNDTFAPPELKNYPVQGFGGEIVQAMMGRLVRHFINMDWYGGLAFLINTVHDCFWTDAHESVARKVAADVKRIMESVPQHFNDNYNMNIDVPFPCEVEGGRNMLELSHDYASKFLTPGEAA